MSKKKRKKSRRNRDEGSKKHVFIHDTGTEQVEIVKTKENKAALEKKSATSKKVSSIDNETGKDLKLFVILGSIVTLIIIVVYITSLSIDFNLPFLK